MKPAEPLALNHSWPLFERRMRFDLGCLAIPDMTSVPSDDAWLASRGIGRWTFDLATRRLDWTSGVFELFDWPGDRPLHRNHVLPLYHEESRAAMERLRAYAIRHKRGFTLDIAIRAGDRDRWARLIAAPRCRGKQVIAIEGWKMDVTADYR